MHLGELAKRRSALRRQPDANETPVAGACLLADQPACGGSLDQPHDGVVALLKEFREFRNGGPVAPRITRDPQEQLVLLGSQATGARGALAEAQKAPEMVTKPRQATKGASRRFSL